MRGLWTLLLLCVTVSGQTTTGSGATNQCYHCANDGSGGSGVKHPNDCTNLVSCQSDEMCGAETYRMSTHESFEFKCVPKQICAILTRQALMELDACRKPNADPVMCNLIGKRATSGHKICTACCGDSQCNSDSCESTIERLYNLWKGGALDLDTLKTNATVPTTTSSG